MKKPSKTIILFILVIGGTLLIGNGIFTMFYIDDLVEPVDISKYNITLIPEKLEIPRSINPEQLNTSSGFTNILELDLKIYTFDVWAVNNPIYIEGEMKVINPDNIEKIGIVLKQQSIFLRDESPSERLKFIESRKQNIMLFEKTSNNLYKTPSEPITFFIPIDNLNYAIFIQTLNGNIEIFEEENALFSVLDYSKKLQTDVNRITIEQVIQSAKYTQSQIKNNHIIEGLSFIIVGWIPLELAIHLRREESAQSRELGNIQQLVLADFLRLYELVTKDEKKLRNEIKNFEKIVIPENTGYNRSEIKIKEKEKEVQDQRIASLLHFDEQRISFQNRILASYEFNFWEAMYSSGSLIKLSPNDLELIQIAYDSITDENEEIIKSFNNWLKFGSNYMGLIEKYRENTLEYLEEFLESVLIVKETLDNLKEISWIKFDNA